MGRERGHGAASQATKKKEKIYDAREKKWHKPERNVPKRETILRG